MVSCMKPRRGLGGCPISCLADGGAFGLLLRIREPVHVLAKATRGIHERRERSKVARTRVETKQIETDALEGRNTLREMCRRRLPPPLQDGGVRTGWGDRGKRVDLGARRGRALLERRDDCRQFRELLAVCLRQRCEKLR